MDYSLCESLNYNTEGISRFIVCYDIACQFFTHFHDRVRRNEYLSIPSNISIEKAIGLFHIHGHQEECFPKYSPNFIPGMGQVDGEIVETLWSQLNEVSGSTRSMAAFHRRETLDDHMNDSNWKKLVRMVPALCKKLQNARKQRDIFKKAYIDLSATVDPDVLLEWEEAEADALQQRPFNLDAMKLFDVNMTKGIDASPFLYLINVNTLIAPGQAKVELDLAEKEVKKPSGTLGLAAWLSTGIKIQESQ
jgi:hypothetical protein